MKADLTQLKCRLNRIGRLSLTLLLLGCAGQRVRAVDAPEITDTSEADGQLTLAWTGNSYS